MAHTYGPIFKFHAGSKLYVVINTLEIAKEVLRDQDNNFTLRIPTVAAKVITYGAQDISFSRSNWRELRKLFISEVLSHKNLEASSHFRRSEVRKTIKKVYSKIGTTVNISEVCFSTEASVISSMIWQNSSDEKGGKASYLGDEFHKVAAGIIQLLLAPNVSDFIPSLAWLDVQGVKRDMKKHLKKMDQIYTKIFDDRIKSNLKKLADGIGHDEGKKDFLQILLELKDMGILISDIPIVIKIMDFVIGGTETTVTVIEWVMTEIIKNREVMKRIQEELAQVVGADNIVEESHLKKLLYLDATVKETFRLHPVGPVLAPRSPIEGCIVGGYTIPKGCHVYLNVWSIQRDPRYWDNPLEFNPERFLTYDGTNKWDYNGNNLKFLPFGSGRRACPGISLAIKMQLYTLASLLHSFDWNLPEGEKLDFSDKFGLTLKKTKPVILIPSQRLSNVRLYT
ncbi:cytochrome P450 [Tanacetum coccineum]